MKAVLILFLGAFLLLPLHVPAQPIAKITVSAAGTVDFNGKRTTLEALDGELARLKSRSGVVWYHRENPATEPHPNASAVVDLIIKHKLPVSMSAKPDFSDYVDEQGTSRPRK